MRELCSHAGGLVCKSLVVAIFLLLFPIFGHTQCSDGIIEGSVFLDENVNGGFESSENGVSGKLITLFDETGSIIATEFTNSSGNYQFSGLTNDDSYRVEVSFIQGYNSSHIGTDHLSDIRNVSVPACNVNFGLTNASVGCNNNPELLVTCFVRGDITSFGGNATILGIDYQFDPSTPTTVYATKAETGSIWGLAYDDKNQDVYSSSFVKQYAALTPYGHDAIFKTNLSTRRTEIFVKLSDLGIDTGSLLIADESDCGFGSQVGKVGIGNIVLSPDGGSLYAVNIFKNTLVRIPLVNPTSSNVQEFSIPDPGCTGGVARSFALEYHEGRYYVGITCDGSISLSNNDSSAIVYEFDPSTGSFVEIFETNEIRGYWDDSNPGAFITSHWFSDIDFTDEGNMLIGLSDRYGHTFCDGSFGRVDQQYPDLLMAWNNNGTWTLESNGVAGSLIGSGVDNGEGPDGGEFFGFDFFPGNPNYHNEVALGSFFALPGSGEVVAAVYDPLFNAYAGGLHRYNTLDGTYINGRELYAQNLSDQFGKATGFGELVAVCPRPSPEIGNYVWFDANSNGIQDPSEEVVVGLDIVLLDAACNVVGVTTTDANGIYRFNNTNVSNVGLTNPVFDGLYTNQQYYVSIDPSFLNLTNGGYNINGASFNLTSTGVDSELGSDLITDANTCAGQDVRHLIPVSITSDDEVNHSYDIGLVAPTNFDLALIKTVSGNSFPKMNEDVTFLIEVINQGDVVATEVEVTDYLNRNFAFKASANPQWTVDNGKAKYVHTEALQPNDSFTVPIVLTLTERNDLDFENFAEISRTVDQFGNVNSDIDSTADDIDDNDNGAFANTNTDNSINEDPSVDEDDHDVALIEVFDLAIRKLVSETRPYQPGERVTFNISVINQGNIAAQNFTIHDEFPSTLTFLSGPSQNGWIQEAPNVISFRDNAGLAVGQTKVVQVTFQVGSFDDGQAIRNTVEISDARSETGNWVDVDSDADADLGNDLLVDNEIFDFGVTDEDDHDIAEISGLKVDLALMKKARQTSYQRGDEVEFLIYVYNQGEVVLDNILVVDYMHENLILNDDSWISDENSQSVYKTVQVEGGLQPNDFVILSLNTIVSPNAELAPIDNFAEIMSATDLFGFDVAQYDCDSFPDGDASNDIGGRPDTDEDDRIDDDGLVDEDDSDPARIFVAELDVETECMCLGNATTSMNGQFLDAIKIRSKTGETWFIEYVNGFYTTASGNPPAAPIPFVSGESGYQLVETIVEGGYSEYTIEGIHVENAGYEIRLQNEFGLFIQHSNTGCGYSDINVTTDPGESLYSACAGSARTYSIEMDDACTVLWTLPDGTTQTDETITYNWGASGGTIQVEVDCGIDICTEPRFIEVDLGGGTGAIACIFDTNVSMDSDCEILVTPEMIHAGTLDADAAYGVMLFDPMNNPIINNTITAEHIGMTLTVKLIDSCSGNSCWANIFVEDKFAPEIQCGDITIACHLMETYMPIATDNCGEVAEVVILSETVTPLVCDPDYTKRVERSYHAIDDRGNVSEPCSQTILIERFDFDRVVEAPSYRVIDGTALKCSDVIYGEDGTPSIEFAGVPTFWDEPLYPFPDFFCNVGIDVETLTVAEEGCVRKYVRTWTLYEAHCGLGVIETYMQTIEIEDQDAPVVTCEDNEILSTSGDSCERSVFLPPPASIEDDCDGPFQVDIQYPGGFLNNAPQGGTVVLPVGQHTIMYTVSDACGNSSQCPMEVTIVDETSPTAICDQNTIVALRGDGTAEAFASTFDDGSSDDCNLYTLLVQRIDQPEDCPCDLPSFHDMDYLGELDGHFYYLSKNKTTSFQSYAFAQAKGGHPAIIETDNENAWIRSQVDGLLAGEEYFIGINDADQEGTFVWNNGYPVNYTNWNGGAPVNTADFVVATADGTWAVVPEGREEAYVLEITDPCGWSDFVNFCCEDAGLEHMVALRAVDDFGRVTNCMAMVEVQDKIAPQITCPAPVTIECTQPIDMSNLAAQFGMATAVDGCQSEVVELDPLVAIDNCGVGQIKRTFRASDTNGFEECEQLITIINSNAFDESRITWPEDYFSDEGCNAGALTPENLPAGFDEPVVVEEFCDLVGVEHRDDIFFFTGDDADACFKILRTWEVFDWCTFDEEDSDLNSIDESTDDGIIPGFFTRQQTIKINNTVDPVITGCEFQEQCTFDCDSGFIELRASATDDCTPSENLVWSFEIDLFADGVPDSPAIAMSGIGGNIVADGTYPVGLHTILYTFEDRCGNMVSCLKEFEIVNCSGPTAACIQGLAVGLEAMDLDGDGVFDTEMGCVWAFAFDASSSHPCGQELEIVFCDDPNDPSTYTDEKCFDCADCGTQVVNICVIDEVGNVDFCTTTVEVQDNNSVDLCEDASTCVIPPVSELLVETCDLDFSPETIGGQPDVTADCFCDDFTMEFSDDVLETALTDCTAIIRTWTVTPNCGCTSSTLQYTQNIMIMNLENPTVTAPVNVSAVANDDCQAVGVDVGLAIAFGACNTGLLISNSHNGGGNDASGTYPLGITEVIYTVTDDCLNTGTAMAIVEVTDESAPSCDAVDVTVVLDNQDSGTVTLSDISSGVTDNCDDDPDVFILTIDGQMVTSQDYDCTDLGVNSIVVIVTDEAGNSTTCAADVTVVENEPPVCTATDIVVAITQGNSVTVTSSDLGIGATDNCSGDAELTVTPSSFVFDCDDIGDNTVTFTVTDASGNSSTCTANVTVNDGVAPVCSIQDFVVNLTGDDMLITLDDLDFTVMDDCGALATTTFTELTVNCDMLNGQETETLENVLNITVTDTFGNSSTCSADVILMDVSEIMCVAQDITVSLGDAGQVFITAADIDNGSTAGCDSDLEMELDFTMFGCNNVGENIVTLTVTSDIGDTATCTATVTIEDDVPPALSPTFCPADVTVQCDADISDLDEFGVPDMGGVIDNCSNSFDYEEEVVMNLNSCNIGVITRTFTLQDILGNVLNGIDGNPLMCTQIVTIEGGLSPITIDDIVWPDSPVTIDCSDPDIDDMPVVDISNAECSDIVITSEDVLINDDGTCDFVIERTFTVTDNCQLPGGVFTFTQVINITDSTAPVIGTSPDDLTVDLTDEDNTCSAIITLDYNVTDDCLQSGDVTVTIDAPGLVSQTPVAADGSVSFDVEFCALDQDLTITMTATDACGNVSTDELEVSVVGEGCLTFNCQKFIFAMEPDGSIDINSNDYDIVDNECGHIDVDISYDDMNINDTLATYDCQTIIDNGINPNINDNLYFYIDGEVIDSCRIVVFFSNDPNGDGDPADGWREICGLATPDGFVTGTVNTPLDVPVQDVEVALVGSPFENVMTTNIGTYAFPSMLFGDGPYTILPEKHGDYLNGISTLDIIQIQKHILSIQEFNSPYQHIAADVNDSKSVSSLDIIELRKLILGIKDEFTASSWRMVDENYVFPDPNDPLKSNFDESYYINEFEIDMNVNFIGVKVGDINSSASTGFHSSASVESRSNRDLLIHFNEKDFADGEVFDIELSANVETSLDGMQFAFNLDQDLLMIEEVILNEETLYSNSNVNTNNIDQGEVKVSWNKRNELNNDEQYVMMTVRVLSKGNGSVSQAISINEKAMKSESYFNSEVGSIVLLPDTGIETENEIVLYQNNPNPWSESTTISYYMSTEQDVTFNVFDINGKLIKTIIQKASAGMNELQISKVDIETTGVLYYELITNRHKISKKMLLVK